MPYLNDRVYDNGLTVLDTEAKAFDVSRPYTIFTGQITFETTLIH